MVVRLRIFWEDLARGRPLENRGGFRYKNLFHITGTSLFFPLQGSIEIFFSYCIKKKLFISPQMNEVREMESVLFVITILIK